MLAVPSPASHAPLPAASTLRYAAAGWIFANAADDIRAGRRFCVRDLFNKLPPAWICGSTPRRDNDPMSIDAHDFPSLYGKAGRPSIDRSTLPRERHARRPAFMPYRGPMSPTGSDFRLQCFTQEPLLAHAARFGHRGMVAAILNHYGNTARLDYRDPDGYSLLHIAAWSGNPACVAVLLDESRRCDRRPADPLPVDMPGPDGETPIHVAIVLGNAPLFHTLLLFNADIRIRLTDAGPEKPKFLTADAQFKLANNEPIAHAFDSVKDFALERAPGILLARPDKTFVTSPRSEGTREKYCTVM